MNDDAVGTAVEAAVDALRDALKARHGWTHVDVQATVHAASTRVELRGEVAVDRLREQVANAVGKAIPGWDIGIDELAPMRGGHWHAAAPQVVPLLASWPGLAGPRRLATELLPQYGPVQHLATVGDASVVRVCDGTVGWWEGPLGERVATPALSSPQRRDASVLTRAAEPWLGVPYVLGGVTETGIDCSALVQRLVRDQLQVVVPRHSSDQLHLGARLGHGEAPGDLCFVWSDREALCHVGIGTGPT
nr:C40 family peptidase [Deltaproteobacteria bacterium]